MKKVLMFFLVVAATFSFSDMALAAANPGPIEELINNTLAEWEEVREIWEGIAEVKDEIFEILEKISGLEDTTQEIIEDMPGELKVYDGNGQYLGLLVGGNGFYAYDLFITDIGIVSNIYMDGRVGFGPFETYYETIDCTTTPYLKMYGTERPLNDTLFSFANSRYGYLDPSDNGSAVAVQSVMETNGDCNPASPNPSWNYVEVVEVGYPYSDPIQTPYDVRCE